MAKTYTWQSAIDLASKMTKGVPLTSIDALICDMVNSTIWKAYPWYDSLTNIAAGTIPLVDKQQDYSSPVNCYRLTKLSLVRTDVTPNQSRELDVQKDVSVDLVWRSPYQIRCASLQPEVGRIRLESAVSVPTGATWEIQGQYQLHPVKITALTQNLWMHDEHLEVPAKGILYWAYRLSDDPRAGEAVKVSGGRTQYTGQLAAFMDAIDQMAAAEDFGNIDCYSPADAMGGDGRRWYPGIWPWGY